MEIESAPGRGTRITLTAPVGRTSNAVIEISDRKVRKDDPGIIKIRHPKNIISVLVVDDHKIMREGLSGLFKDEPDIEVVGEAADGPQAIEMTEELKPDVIIMDVNLGKMSGVKATQQILSHDPHIKVIGLSIHTDKTILLHSSVDAAL